MTAEKQKRRLNLSQLQIAMSQQASPDSARNTISVRIYLPDHLPEEVQQAANTVLDSADIFTASVCSSTHGYMLLYGSRKVSACTLQKERSRDLADDYMDHFDRRPLDMEKELYQAQVIPLSGGGVCLYVRFHHILIDGYGMSLFAQRVLDVLAGKEIPSSIFADYAGTKDTPKTEHTPGEDGKFWNSYFADAAFEPAVFLQRASGTAFGSYKAAVPNDLMQAIQLFGKREGIPVSAVFSAAYAYYLAQATGKKEAVFLMPRLNRTAEQRQTLGCYTLLVPVRVMVDQTDTYAVLCRKVKAAADQAAGQKGYGFDRILSVLRDGQVIADAVSEYVFNFYRFQFRAEFAYRISFSVAGDMRNHLTFNLFQNESGGIDMQADYHKGVYTEEKAAYFCDAIVKILTQGICANIQQPGQDQAGKKLSDISILGEKEYQKVLSITGKTVAVNRELTIPSLFQRAVSRYPDRPAVYAGEHSLTFAQMDEMSSRIACGLLHKGVKRGDSVVFLLQRDFRLIPVILGISKAGAVFIPADPAYPPERISYIVENSKAVMLISSADVKIAQGYDYIEADELLSMELEPQMLPHIEQDNPAYMIYTSGTTGRPKGVVLSHRGIANIVHPDNNPFNRDITKNCHGIVAVGSICFDISLFEIFVPLMNGMFVELGNERSMTDAGELARHILRHHADILHCTPSRITAYLANTAFTEALGSIKAVLAAGEVLPPGLVKRLADTYHIRIYNGYGPTETTIGATVTEAGDAVSIGMPVANAGIVLLNKQKQLVPFGAVGEICVYGNGVGLGYQDRPQETAEKYIQWNGKRMYRTGDLGYFLDDGRLMYCGRIDRQVKLRGLRIELSEIEAVMSEYPGIAACSCLVRKMEKTDRLLGFYTVQENTLVDAQNLKAHMKSRLTSYMVPDVLKELAVMPQTPNGKTDLKALELEPVTYVRTYRKPQTELEISICDVFAQVLHADQVGLDDNFFELGGDSLSAAAAVLSIQEKLEGEMDLTENALEYGDLYQFPTPALLLEKICKGTDNDSGFDLQMLDYQGINEFLAVHAKAGMDSVCNGQTIDKTGCLGNVLLTGVTGYLGCHIFEDLLKRPQLFHKIICLARPKKRLTARKRVKSALFYYAEQDFSELYGQKWLVAEGDITDPKIFTEQDSDIHHVPIHTIINCAADVSHFSYGSGLEEINTQGVRNLIHFAGKKHALLCQISTISVAGLSSDNMKKESFGEQDFYIGQEIDNQYIYSKYMAEYEMLRAAVDKGLKIKLMRVGNLQGRIRDGEFQMNLHSNAFTRQFSTYVKLGAVPMSVYEASVNFSPVDETAHNIVSLAAGGGEAAAFHVYPPTELKFASLFQGVQKLGYQVEILPDEQFFALVKEKKRTQKGQKQLEGLVTNEHSAKKHEICVTQEFTNRCLKQLSEGWSTVKEEYISLYLSALNGMNLFEAD